MRLEAAQSFQEWQSARREQETTDAAFSALLAENGIIPWPPRGMTHVPDLVWDHRP